jgi:uncharacterized damage-inducible protein DinB
MKELFIQFAAYHAWANELLFRALLSLPEELHKKEVPSSFNSLFKTVLHLWDAESIWWQRLKLQEKVVPSGSTFSGSLQQAVAGLSEQNRLWQEWVRGSSEQQLQQAFSYRNSRGEAFNQPVSEMLLHLFNHGTYHRGQLVNILRQLEVTQIPQTDFIVWSRSVAGK